MSTAPVDNLLDAKGVARAWKDAQALWDATVTLSPPQPYEGRKGSHWKGDEPLAYVDLTTRQVVVNLPLLAEIGASDCLTGVLAHEIGHHVRFPHTLGLAASLILLERRLIPGLSQSLTNLFFDLQVNEFVGRTRKDELAKVYRGFVAQAKDETSPLFFFYLTIYEELWGLEHGSLVPKPMIPAMEKKYPGYASDARVFVQTFYALTSVHTQFVYFCCRFIRYIEDPSKLSYSIPMGKDVAEPDADDFDAAIRGRGGDDVEDALQEAGEKGWLEDSGVAPEAEEDPLVTIDKISQHLPGKGGGDFKLMLVSKHYKRLVDSYILRVPPGEPAPEPFLPSTTEDWEWGDNPRLIDWTASVLASGPLAGARPLRRDLLPDEPSPESEGLPAVEIYLDTSGSMPDPGTALNAMTLAAQILVSSALRKGGLVRGAIYSHGPVKTSPWMRHEETARRFFLHYVGGGTDYPFPLLWKWANENSGAVRVIISDSDFLSNVQGRLPKTIETLQFAAERSRMLVAFLATHEKHAKPVLAAVMNHPRFRLACVTSLSDFGKAAARLAEALFGR